MNNSYNYSSFIGLNCTHDEIQRDSTYPTATQHLTEPATRTRDEVIDNFLFSSALSDINYTD